MKRIVCALGVVSVLIGVVLALMCIGENVLLGIGILAIAVLVSVPFFALVGAMEHIEKLQEDINEIYRRLNKLRTDITPAISAEPPTPKGRTALSVWSCQKCGTINKAGTNHCDSCGAIY